MNSIDVQQISDSPARFDVTVQEDGDESTFEVLVTEDEFERYNHGADWHELVKATFLFLLDKESVDAILDHFQLSDVEKYFPEYPDDLPDYLD